MFFVSKPTSYVFPSLTRNQRWSYFLKYHCSQGRNKGGTILRAPNDYAGRRQVPTMSQVLSSMQYICFRKTSGSNMGTPYVLLALGAS